MSWKDEINKRYEYKRRYWKIESDQDVLKQSRILAMEIEDLIGALKFFKGDERETKRAKMLIEILTEFLDENRGIVFPNR